MLCFSLIAEKLSMQMIRSLSLSLSLDLHDIRAQVPGILL